MGLRASGLKRWDDVHKIFDPLLIFTSPHALRQHIILDYCIGNLSAGQVGELLSVSEQQLVDCAKGSCSVSFFTIIIALRELHSKTL